jgi:hypothetical protein
MSKTRSSLKQSISKLKKQSSGRILKKPCIGCVRNVPFGKKNEIVHAQDRNILAPNTG